MARTKIFPNRLTTYVNDEVWEAVKERLAPNVSESEVVREILEEWLESPRS